MLDGLCSTMWQSAEGETKNQWLDFQMPPDDIDTAVVGIGIIPAPSADAPWDCTLITDKFYSENNPNKDSIHMYTEVRTFQLFGFGKEDYQTEACPATAWQDFHFHLPVKSRYWRLLMTRNHGGDYMAVRELRLYRAAPSIVNTAVSYVKTEDTVEITPWRDSGTQSSEFAMVRLSTCFFLCKHV